VIPVRIDVPLARRLVAAQFPRWAGLPVKMASSGGTDNVMFRLGTELAVRLPRRQYGADHLERELRWLPFVGPRLPLAVPAIHGKGVPGEGYPWPWLVCSWLPGEIAVLANLLVRDGELTSIIDFGLLGTGDPGCDLMAAWTCLPAPARRVFREAVARGGGPADDAAWARARGWALSLGLRAAAWATGNPVVTAIGHATIAAVLPDRG
jgi:aminoglycoside phosphotransferase (APT) family kinase protein